MLDRTDTEILIAGASISSTKTGLVRWGREVTGALPSDTEISKRIREKESESVLDLEKNARKFTENVA